MRRYFLCFMAALLLGMCLPFPAFAMTADDITAEAAVLMDLDTGQVLYDKHMHKRSYPASTTKIMTGLLAMENGFPGEILTVTESAIDIDEPESSNIALTPGEELTLDDAMYALMLPSANDVANVIAEHIAGSKEEFARMMTTKAKQIGAFNTNFSNAHGLHEQSHYTTPYDLALITRYAAGDALFMRYFGEDLHTMPATNKQPLERPFTNYQYMLVKGTRFYNADVIGGKIGYTTPAKHTMSTVATKNGRTLVCVVMGCGRDEKFTDTQALLDFGFGEFTKITIPKEEIAPYIASILEDGAQIGEVRLTANSDIDFLLHNSIDPAAVQFSPTIPATYSRDDKPSGTLSLVAEAESEAIPSLLATKSLVSARTIYPLPALDEEEESSPPATLPIPLGWMIVIGGVFLLVVVFSFLRYRRYLRRKARLERLNRRLRTAANKPETSRYGAMR
jgi:D-alanyl-D-alanine carboxypeptidase (penicillin-binding protein 5/6)